MNKQRRRLTLAALAVFGLIISSIIVTRRGGDLERAVRGMVGDITQGLLNH